VPINGLKQFQADLENFVLNVVPTKLTTLQRAICFEALGKIIERTPRDIGQTVGNWQVTVNYKPNADVERHFQTKGNADKSGSATLARGMRAIATIPPFCTVFITNNSEHIRVLEEGLFDPPDPGPSKDPRPDRKGKILVAGGYSVQAPHGMVAVTIQDLRTKYMGGGT